MCICLHWISFAVLSLSQFYEILVQLLTVSVIFALNASETTVVSFHFTEHGYAGRYAVWFIPLVFPVSETVLHGNTSFLIILFPPRHSVSLRASSERLTRSPLVHTLVETFQELQQDINVTYLYKSCMDPSQHIIGEFLATCTCICVQDILQHWNLAMLLSRTDTRKLYRWYRGNHITMQSNPCVQTKSCFPIFFFWIHHRY